MSDMPSQSLYESSKRIAGSSPVFIIGHPRSGTSMLFRTLQQHPSFSPKEVNLRESQIIRRLSTAFRWNDDNPRQLLGFMLGNRDEYHQFLEETRSLRLKSMVSAPASIPMRGRIPTSFWQSQGLHLVVRSFFAHAWTARGCTRLVDKSPRNVPHIAKLKLVSPKSKMLFMSRHPVDTMASYRARVRRDPSAKWADVSTARFVRIYREGVLGALQTARRNSSLLVTKYEDFTRNPTEEFRRICEFLDEEYFASCVTDQVDRQQRAVESALLYGPVSTNERRWREDVDEATAHRVEIALAPVMSAAGYQPYT